MDDYSLPADVCASVLEQVRVCHWMCVWVCVCICVCVGGCRCVYVPVCVCVCLKVCLYSQFPIDTNYGQLVSSLQLLNDSL